MYLTGLIITRVSNILILIDELYSEMFDYTCTSDAKGSNQNLKKNFLAIKAICSRDSPIFANKCMA